jgi:hypothetical protein
MIEARKPMQSTVFAAMNIGMGQVSCVVILGGEVRDLSGSKSPVSKTMTRSPVR